MFLQLGQFLFTFEGCIRTVVVRLRPTCSLYAKLPPTLYRS